MRKKTKPRGEPVLEKEYSKHLMIGGGTRSGPMLAKGKGCGVKDTNGKKYVDFPSQN